MGLFDKLGGTDKAMETAKEQLRQHDQQVDAGLDRAGQMAGEKFGHGDQINQGVDAAKGGLDKFAGVEEIDQNAGADDVAEGDPTNNA